MFFHKLSGLWEADALCLLSWGLFQPPLYAYQSAQKKERVYSGRMLMPGTQKVQEEIPYQLDAWSDLDKLPKQT